MSDEELETALRRVLSTSPEDVARRSASSRRLQSLPPQKRAFAWWPAALMDVSFAPAWPRVAALAGAAVLGISIGLSNFGTRVATDLDLVRVASADDASTNAFDFGCGTTPMTMTMTMPDRSSRWLLIGSLALNLFFIGTIGSLAARHYVMPAQPAATERPRTAAARIERLAAPLPAADAEKLRAAFRARETAAEGARDALNKAYERAQGALRAQPFDPAVAPRRACRCARPRGRPTTRSCRRSC